MAPEVVLAYERLASVIRDQILSSQLRPGDQLPVEPELCIQYQVSRSTVREALRVLSSQNLVVTTRGASGGTFVVRPEPEHVFSLLKTALSMLSVVDGQSSVDDLLEVRRLLEVPATGLAAVRRTDEQLEDLRSSLYDPREIIVGEIGQATRNFHLLVLRAAANPMLTAVAVPIHLVLQDRLNRENAPLRFWRQVDKEHRKILACLEAGDAAAAEQAQSDHLDHLRTTYIRIDRVDARAPEHS